MRFSLVMAVFCASGMLVACGPKQAKSPGEEREGDKDYAGQDDGSNERPKKRGTPPTEQSHKRYLSVCVKSQDLADYCECSWGVMAKMFTNEEMNGDDINDVRMARLKSAVGKQCIDKMPEPALRDAFIGGCKKDDAQLDPYCGCMWTELRKTFSAGQLAQPEIVRKTQFKQAVAVGAKSCTAKIPEPVVKKAFFQGCAKRAGYEAFCACGWKELRARVSLGEIRSSADTPEMKAVYDEVAKKCAKLLPGQNGDQ
jgi:hypothetical protein